MHNESFSLYDGSVICGQQVLLLQVKTSMKTTVARWSVSQYFNTKDFYLYLSEKINYKKTQ